MKTDAEKNAMHEAMDRELEEECFLALNAMFAAHRLGRPSALTKENVPYIVFLNGALHEEGSSERPPVFSTRREAMCATLKGVEVHWPNHASQTLVWRHPRPTYEHQWWPDQEWWPDQALIGGPIRERVEAEKVWILRIRVAAIDRKRRPNRTTPAG